MENRLNTSCDISFTLNNQRIKKDGTATIYIKIKVQKEVPIKIPLPISWPPDKFDRKKQLLKPRFEGDEDLVAFSAIMDGERSKYWRVVKRYLLDEKFFTVDDIVDGVAILTTGKTIANYIDIRSKQKEREKEIKNHTGDNHRATANSIRFYKKVDPDITEIGKKWIDRYLFWLMQSMTYAAAWTHVKNVRTYINDAKKRGLTINETFAQHQLAKPESDPVYLDRDELEKLLNLYNDPFTSEENHDCIRSFLFACFTGMRISDLKRFDSTWIIDGEIVFTPVKVRITEKRNQQIKIPVVPVAEQFLKNLNGRKLVIRSEQKFNERLKTIASLAGINKKITTHVARHTFGTMLAVNGTPVVIISKLLGHKTLKSTMVYIHIAEKVKQLEMLRLQSAFSQFTVHRNTA